MWVGGATLTMVHVLSLNGQAEGQGQGEEVHVVALLAHRFHLLLAELLNSLATLNEVLKELALLLQVA